MRITKIAVKGLFGMFDHEIPLNQESRITIVHGPNGVGKTVLLQLVKSLFQCEYEQVGKIAFERFRVEFDNSGFVTVENFQAVQNLLISFDDGSDSSHIPFRPRTFVSDVVGNALTKLNLDVEFKRQLGRPRWESNEDSSFLTEKDLLKQHPDVHTLVYGETPDWFVNIQKEVKVDLIETERLRRGLADDDELMGKILNWDPIDDDELYSRIRSTVDHILDEVITASKFSRDDHIEAVKVMKLKYPDLWPLPPVDDLEELELDEYASTMIRAVQLSEDTREEFFRIFVETMGSLHIEKKVLLENIIEERFIFKTLTMSDHGFRICTVDGSEIPGSSLSSGEKHLLVLYGRLIFQVPSDSLLMIDEPELSLHVDWQEYFLKDIQRIIKLRKFDVILATHSPTLIDDKWEWTVGLGYPESEISE